MCSNDPETPSLLGPRPSTLGDWRLWASPPLFLELQKGSGFQALFGAPIEYVLFGNMEAC